MIMEREGVHLSGKEKSGRGTFAFIFYIKENKFPRCHS